MLNDEKNAKIDALIGKVTQATVSAIQKDVVIIKIDDLVAFIRRDELSALPELESTIDVYVEGEAKNGLLACSTLKVEPAKILNEIQQAFLDHKVIQATVVGVEENGLICDVMRMYGFMPKRQIEVSNINGPLEAYIGKTLSAQIIKCSNDGTVIISHREVIEKDVLKAREQLTSNLALGNVYTATITQIVSYGAFADIGAGVEGLIHRSNLSWSNADPAEVVAIGDKVKVTITSLENGKIGLDHKAHIEDTWAQTAANYKVDDVVEGTVTSLTNFGAFVSIGGKVEGLVHNTELSWDNNISSANQCLKLKDKVRVRILAIDNDKRKLSLSLKRASENPWSKAADTYKIGKRCSLRVLNIADFGLFVDMGDGLKGLIHQNDISWLGGSDFKKTYKVGDTVECLVLSCDAEHGKASFGIKQLTEDPWNEFVESRPLGKAFDAEIKRIAKFGAFAQIENVEGLIHISELAAHRVKTVSDVVSVGDKVKVTVVTIDAAKRRLGLSMTAQPFEADETDYNNEPPKSVHEKTNATLADILPDGLKK